MKKLIYILSIIVLAGCSSSKDKSRHNVFNSKKGERQYIAAYNATLKLWPVKYEEKDIPTTYGTAHVIIAGPEKGEPLVLFHGMDASSTMWYPNIKDYSSKYRVYAIDYILEPGKSVLKGERPNKEQVVDWYNEVFAALKLKKFNLLGTSRGGWLATNYTLANQDRVEKLLLLSPVQTFGLMDMNSKMRKAVNFKFFPNRKRMRKAVQALSFHPEKVDERFMEQVYLGTKHSKTSFDMLEMAPFKDDLKKITIPVLVLVGDHDILCGPDITEVAKEKLPDVEAAVIKDAGHFLTIDQKKAVDKKVLDFLNKK